MIKSFNLICEKCSTQMEIVPCYTVKDKLNREVEMVFRCPKCDIDIIFNATIPKKEIKAEGRGNIMENDKEKIGEINFLIGALDGLTVERVKGLIRILTVTQWALGRLMLLNEHSNREYAIQTAKEISEKVKEAHKKEDEILQKSKKS